MRLSADRSCRLADRFHSRLGGDEHVLIPQRVVIDDDMASCHVLVHARHVCRKANGGCLQTLVGTYELDGARTDDGWKIFRSIGGMHWTEGNWQFHAGLMNPPADN